MKGMELERELNSKYGLCLFCGYFENDFCYKYLLPRSPIEGKCWKFKKSILFLRKKVKSRNFLLIFSLYFMIYFCVGIIPPNIEGIINSLPSISEFSISTAILFYLICNSVSVLFFGYFRERILHTLSSKILFLLTNLLWITSFGLISISFSYPFFFSLLMISAIGTGGYIPLGFSKIGEMFPAQERGSRFGLMQFALILGNGIGIITGSILHWRIAFNLGFYISMIVIIIYFVLALDSSHNTLNRGDQLNPNSYNYKLSRHDLVSLFKIRSVISILFYVLTGGLVVSVLGNWGIYILSSNFKNSDLATLIYLIIGIAALPGAIIGGKINDRLFRKRKHQLRFLVAMIGVLGGSLSLLIFYVFPFAIMVFTLMLGFIGYFFTSFTTGTQFAVYSEVCLPETRSTANALNGLMVNIGGICGNFILSIIIFHEGLSIQNAVFLILLVWLAGSLLWLFPIFYYHKDILKQRDRQIKRRIEKSIYPIVLDNST
ncbi:MAG: MFS transporter [Candidatus Lokiarchaeota archaeon]|nr:MFS transporter [Candidatus Lokiarchaeota archaeon]